MRPEFVTPHSADRFDAVIDGSNGNAPLSARDVEAFALVTALRSAAAPVVARADFVENLRERLIAQAHTDLAIAPAPKRRAENRDPGRSPRDRRFAVGVGALALVGATASMGVAAQSSLPGDTLYPLKRAVEQGRATFERDDVARGSVLLARATNRLDEIDQLSRGDATRNSAAISATFGDFSDQAGEAAELLMSAYDQTGQPATINDVRMFVAQSLGILRQLEPLIPRETQASLLSSSQLLSRIDERAVRVCPTCSSAPWVADAPIMDEITYDKLVIDVVRSAPVPGVTLQATSTTSSPQPPKPETTKKSSRPQPTKPKTDVPDPAPAPQAPQAPPAPEVKLPVEGPAVKAPRPPDPVPKVSKPVKKLTNKLVNGGNTSGPRIKDLGRDAQGTVKDLTDQLAP